MEPSTHEPRNDDPNRALEEELNGAPAGVWTAPQPGASKGRRAAKLGTDRPATLQLETRAHEVVKMARTHGLFYRCILEGWDEDDLIQELLLRIHQRQLPGMASRYDPTKSAWGTYVHLVTKTILMNLVEVQRTKNRREIPTDPSVISRWGDGSELSMGRPGEGAAEEEVEGGDPRVKRVVRGVPRYARKMVL